MKKIYVFYTNSTDNKVLSVLENDEPGILIDEVLGNYLFETEIKNRKNYLIGVISENKLLELTGEVSIGSVLEFANKRFDLFRNEKGIRFISDDYKLKVFISDDKRREKVFELI